MVGKGGNCDGSLDEVKSHEMGQGGVKMVVRGARGSVMVTAILTGGEPSTTNPHEHHALAQLITPGRRSTTSSFSVDGHRDRREAGGKARTRAVGPSYSPDPGEQISRYWHRGRDLSLFRSRRSLSIPVPSPHMMA